MTSLLNASAAYYRRNDAIALSLTVPPNSHEDWLDELYQVIKEGDVHSFMELVSALPAQELQNIRFEVRSSTSK